MAIDNDISRLSDQEKLITFHSQSAVTLRKMVDDGKTVLALADELDLPYHIFDLCRTLVQSINTFLGVNRRAITGEDLNISDHKDLERLNKLEQLSPHETIQYLHREIRGRVYTWKFYGQWLLNWFEERSELNLPVELNDWCSLLITGTEKIQELFTIIFNIPSIDSQKPDKALLDMQAHWQANEKAKFPILSQYETYLNALKEVAQKLSLSLFKQIQWEDIFPPSGYVKLFAPKRRAQTRIQNNSSLHNYREYVVTLQWRTNDRYQTWQGYTGIVPSIEDAVAVLHQWLVKDWDVDKIRQEHQWMQKEIIDSGLQPTVLLNNLRKTDGSTAPLSSTHNIYRTEGGGKLIIEATQNAEQQPTNIEMATLSISGCPAYYSLELNEQEKNDDVTENGTLVWSKYGINYKINYSGLKLSVNEIIQIAEGLRWVVL